MIGRPGPDLASLWLMCTPGHRAPSGACARRHVTPLGLSGPFEWLTSRHAAALARWEAHFATRPNPMQLAHAQAVLAREAGRSSWPQLKARLEPPRFAGRPRGPKKLPSRRAASRPRSRSEMPRRLRPARSASSSCDRRPARRFCCNSTPNCTVVAMLGSVSTCPSIATCRTVVTRRIACILRASLASSASVGRSRLGALIDAEETSHVRGNLHANPPPGAHQGGRVRAPDPRLTAPDPVNEGLRRSHDRTQRV